MRKILALTVIALLFVISQTGYAGDLEVHFINVGQSFVIIKPEIL